MIFTQNHKSIILTHRHGILLFPPSPSYLLKLGKEPAATCTRAGLLVTIGQWTVIRTRLGPATRTTRWKLVTNPGVVWRSGEADAEEKKKG